jgi:hypothetical protein
MSHLHARPPHRAWGQYSWDHYSLDDRPPAHDGRTTSAQLPVPVRPTVDVPPCNPHGGVKTDWSGNACAALREGSSQAVLPAQRQPPKTSSEPVTVGQATQPADQIHPSSSVGGFWFDVAIVLGLALVFVAVRRVVLYIVETRGKQFERDDAI